MSARRRRTRRCSPAAAGAAAAAAYGSAAFFLSPALAVLLIPEPDPSPGGPTAYGGTKPGPAAGGGGAVGTVVAIALAGAGGAETGAVVGALGPPIATGLLVAAGSAEFCGVGGGASTRSCGASGAIPANPA